MFRFKIFISLIIFSSFLFGTSIIKNQTREIEKDIYDLNKLIHQKEKDFNETQLDFYYLTSPSYIEKQIKHLDNKKYIAMEFSKIFLDLSSFINLQNKFVTKDYQNEKFDNWKTKWQKRLTKDSNKLMKLNNQYEEVMFKSVLKYEKVPVKL